MINRQKIGIAICLIVTSLISLGMSGIGIYLFVQKDASYERTITALVTDHKYIMGECFLEYSFKHDSKTYEGIYVTSNSECNTLGTVNVRYNPIDPSQNSASIKANLHPRQLEDKEIVGCVLLALGCVIYAFCMIAACLVPWRGPQLMDNAQP